MSATEPPPFEPITRMKKVVLDSVTSGESKRLYGRGIDRFVGWFNDVRPEQGFSKAAVQAFRSHLVASGLSSSTINSYLIAVRRLAVEAADSGVLPSEVAAAIGRVKGMKREGVRTGNWLTGAQAERFIQAPDVNTLKGKRDIAIAAVLVGCGLRREETITLTVEHIQEREARWVIVDLMGKGRKRRSIPMPLWAKTAVDNWTAAAAIQEGKVFRPVNKAGRVVGSQMSAQAVFLVVKKYARLLNLDIAPHDLRRTYSRLAYSGGSKLEQIQLSLAHSSVVTTAAYVGVQQDLRDAPCDHLGLRL